MEIPRRELSFRGVAPGFSLYLKRNCSISPAGLAAIFAGLAAVSIGIGIGFAAFGAWLILPFAGAEALALAVAFFAWARHAADYERIELDGGRLSIEVADAERSSRHVLDALAARLQLDAGRGRLVLRTAQGELEIGRHLDDAARRRLASELEKRLPH
jgi:uncharacterized membrane protein